MSSLPAPDSTARAESSNPEANLLVAKQKEIETLLEGISKSSHNVKMVTEELESSWKRFKSDPTNTTRQQLDGAINYATLTMERARMQDEVLRGMGISPTPHSATWRGAVPEPLRATFVDVLTKELAWLATQDKTARIEMKAIVVDRWLKEIESGEVNVPALQSIELLVTEIQGAQQKRNYEQLLSQFQLAP